MIGRQIRIVRPVALGIALTAVAAILLLASTWARLQYGVDFTDESFYVALPYQFTLGNEPFRDESSVLQTSAVITIPLVRIHGTNEGLVLFFRRSWLALALLTGAVVAFAVAPARGWSAAVLAGAVPVAYTPFAIPSLSYNTLGMLLLTTGLFAGVASLSRPRASVAATTVAVAAMAAAAFAYPTMLPAVLTACIALAVAHARMPGNARRPLVALFATGIICTIAVAVFVARAGVSSLREALALQNSFGMQGGGTDKLKVLWEALSTEAPFAQPLLFTLAGLSLLVSILPRPGSEIAAAALALGLAFYSPDTIGATSFLIVYAALFLSVPILVRRAYGEKRRLLALVWMPAMIAALATAWTSGNGLPNAAIGILPILVLATALFARGPGLLGFLVLIGALHYGSWRFVYRDDAIALLDHKVANGPFAGLRTSEKKLDFLQKIDRDIASLRRGAQTALFYDNFPAGYLLSRMRPLSPTVWIPAASADRRPQREWYRRFYNGRARHPDIVGELRSFPVTRMITSGAGSYAIDPFREFFWTIDERCVAIERDEYTLYAPCPARVVAAIEAESLRGVDAESPLGDPAASQWRVLASDYSGGRAALTSRTGSVMSFGPRLPAGTYLIDASFYSYGTTPNSFIVSIGDREREVRFACREGVRRVANIALDSETGGTLTIRSGQIGQASLILDRIIVRRLDGTAPALAGCASITEPRFTMEAIEAERFSGVTHAADYAAAAQSGWASFHASGYSGDGAVLTMAPGASMRARMTRFRRGRFSVVVKGFSYDPALPNQIELTVGGEARRLTMSGNGATVMKAEFADVQSPDISVRAIAIRQTGLVIDAIELQPQ